MIGVIVVFVHESLAEMAGANVHAGNRKTLCVWVGVYECVGGWVCVCVCVRVSAIIRRAVAGKNDGRWQRILSKYSG
jgi:hypothetical protein